MTDTPTLYDPNTIPIGGPGQPLSNGHLAAHSQIRAEIVVNADAIAANADAIARLPQGFVAAVAGPPTAVILGTGATPIITLPTTPLTAGRRYQVTAYCLALQTAVGTGAWNTWVQLNDPAGLLGTTTFRVFTGHQIPVAGGWMNGSLVAAFPVTTSVNTTFSLSGTAQGPGTPAAQVGINASEIILTDIGAI